MTNPVKPFTPQELEQLADRTLEHYRAHAEDFREGARDHDVSQNIAALLQHIAGPAPFTILDFGCGPGYFLYLCRLFGHEGLGLDPDDEPFFRGTTKFFGVSRVVGRINAQNQLERVTTSIDKVEAETLDSLRSGVELLKAKAPGRTSTRR